MELPNDLSTVMKNVGEYLILHGSEIPEYQRQRIIDVMGPGVSPVDFTVRVTEALYTVADELGDEAKQVVAQTANLAALNGWHGMTQRGHEISNAMRGNGNGPEILETEIEPEEIPENSAPPVQPPVEPNNPPITPPAPQARQPLELTEKITSKKEE